MQRPTMPTVVELLSDPNIRRVAVLEDLVDHTNVGAIFRSAAGLGIDAVLVTPSCADPWYRRSVRVSMGAVFSIPWTRISTWPAGVADLQQLGFTVAALALSDDSVPLYSVTAEPPEKLALVLGSEGHGLKTRTISAADMTVKIPMSHGVDSLNVAAAAAVAFYAIGVTV
jgi:tRNA G18 (ribose-2'-O)-methylase SpoU